MFMEILANINLALGIIFFFAYGYQIFYIFVPFFRKHKKHKASCSAHVLEEGADVSGTEENNA